MHAILVAALNACTSRAPRASYRVIIVSDRVIMNSWTDLARCAVQEDLPWAVVLPDLLYPHHGHTYHFDNC